MYHNPDGTFPGLADSLFGRVFRTAIERGMPASMSGAARAYPSREGLTVDGHDLTEERVRIVLEAIEARLRLSQEVGTWDWDLVTNKLRGSELQCHQFGIDPAMGDGVDREIWRKSVHPSNLAPSEAALEKVLEEGVYFTSNIASSGEARWMNAHGHVFRDSTRKSVRVIGMDIDITECKRAEEQLRRLAAFNEAALKSLGEGLYTIDTQGLVTFMNPAAEELFGWSFAELRGKKMHDMTHHHYRDGRPFPACECAGFQVLTHGKPLKNHEDVFIRKDGTFFDVIYTITPMRDDGGQITGLIVVFSDIAECKRAEAERQKFVSLADHSAEFIGMCDLDFKPFYVNEAGQRLVGLDSLEQACATRVQDYFFPEDQSMITNEFFPRVLRNGSCEVEVRFRHFKTGEALWMIYNVFVVKDEGGRIVGYATLSRDITERKRAEEALRESEEQFRILADAIPQLAWMANANGWIYWYNRRWYEYTGTTPEQMEGWGWQSVHDTETLPAVLERWKGSIATGEPFDMVFPLRGPAACSGRF